MQETGTYNPIHHRPMTSHVSADALDRIVNRIEYNHTRRIDPMTVAGIATDIIAPSAVAGQQLPMLNGWDTRRIRFILNVIIQHVATGLQDEEYFIQGFTDHVGVSLNGSIDPNMMFIVNSFVKVDNYINYDQGGGIRYERKIGESGQIINGDIIYQNMGMNVYGLRPSDMFMGIQSAHIHGSQLDNANTFDNRFRFNGKALKNNKYHVTPAAYLASVTDSYCMANLSARIQANSADIYETSKGLVNQDNISYNSFFRIIKNLKGYANGTIFTMADLEYLDPNISRVTNYLSIGPTNVSSFHHMGQTEFWDGANKETQFATILCNAVPALLMELMISKLAIIVSNNVVANAEPQMQVLDLISITGAEATPFFEVFRNRFLREVMEDITYNNQIKYNLRMFVDVFGDTKLTLSLNGGPDIDYVTPTFCDSILTPMMTNSRDQFFTAVDDIEQVLSHVQEAIGSDYATMSHKSAY